jgi:hypothetical protein
MQSPIKSQSVVRLIALLFFLSPISLNPFSLNAQAPPDAVSLMPDLEIRQKAAGLGKLYKLDSAALAGYDKIVTFKREVYVGKVYNITFSDVRYSIPGEQELTTLAKSLVSQILYADGRRDVFIALEGRSVKQKELVDTSRIIVKNQKDWLKVLVTEDPGAVENLKPYGKLKTRYEADIGNASNDDLMKQAGIVLKKRAAMLKAHCVFIETKFFTNSFGDLPSVEVTGIAYGY